MSRSYVDPRYWDAVAGKSVEAQLLWSILVTHPYAQLVPGLLRYSAVMVADERKLPVEVIASATAQLVQAGLVEYDAEARLFRVALAGEYMPTPGPLQVKGWWRHWQTLPDSPLKYQHLDTLRQACKLGSNAPATKVWESTFGSVSAGVESVHQDCNSQLPLFARTHRKGFETLSKPTDPDTDPEAYTYTETETDLDPERECEGEGANVRGSTNSAGSGNGKAKRNGNGNGHASEDDVASWLEALRSSSQGQIATVPFDPSLAPELSRVVGELQHQGVTVADAKLAGEWMTAGGMTYSVDARWVSKPGNLAGLIAKARTWDEHGRQSVGGKKTSHYHVTGNEVYRNGKVDI